MILRHIFEILPFYLIFECVHFLSNKIGYKDFNSLYFILHFIVNFINTLLLIPYIILMTNDPLFKNDIDTNSLRLIYPMLIGLHTFHLVHHLKEIKYDEVIHHLVTHIFWFGVNMNPNPVYIIPMIGMSGIPGGITYLMLFLQKIRRIGKLTEKYISMYLNIWLRAPICIIGSTLMYVKNVEETNKDIYSYYIVLFMIFFTFINGVHFMNNIIDSYYLTLYSGLSKLHSN